MSDMIKWLMDPATPAKKRTLLVILVSIVGGLNASSEMLDLACEGVENVVCTIDTGYVASTIQKLVDLLSSPQGGAVAFVTGLWAIVSGFKKDKLKKANG